MIQTPNSPSTETPLAILILAAGAGTRMGSGLPKALQPLAGFPLVWHVLRTAAALQPERQIVVVGHGAEAVTAAVNPVPTVLQEERLGTGHAVQACLPQLEGFAGEVLVLYADSPFITPQTLQAMRQTRHQNGAAAVVLGFRPKSPTGYGRLKMEGENLIGIVEDRDATPEEQQIDLCNSGFMLFDATRLPQLLKSLTTNNKAGEYYLTDTIAAAVAAGWQCGVVEAPEAELRGIDTKLQLSRAERDLQRHLRLKALEHGVYMQDPSTVYFSADTQVGQGVVMEPHVWIGPNVKIGDDVTIHAFSHLEGTTTENNVSIGPFTRLRGGVKLAKGAAVGNFVEVKKSSIGPGSKAKHLTYIGDTTMGEGVNVGAGTIVANYDGKNKHPTTIGDRASIGANVVLRAPLTVGSAASIGAGSVITRDVPSGALAVSRAEQEHYQTIEAYRQAKRTPHKNNKQQES